jgi:hypothetical protein
MPDEAPLPAPRSVARPDLTGEHYREVLARLHRDLAPATYLEIGVDDGATLDIARCATVAIDPSFSKLRPVFGAKPLFFLFQMTSDAFFRAHDPRHFLGQEVDLAFIDGMHWWEFVLRDFMNLERSTRRNSVIALHDCVPTNVYIAERENDGNRRRAMGAPESMWAGDGWKVLLMLKKYRPELEILALDAFATGLVLITNLNPNSTVLQERYTDICRDLAGLTLLDYGIDRYFDEIDVRSTGEISRPQDISGRFWF